MLLSFLAILRPQITATTGGQLEVTKGNLMVVGTACGILDSHAFGYCDKCLQAAEYRYGRSGILLPVLPLWLIAVASRNDYAGRDENRLHSVVFLLK